MKNQIACTWLFVWSVSGAAGAKPTASELQQKAHSFYSQALASFGVAMGEREDPDDPALVLLNTSVAEIFCLKGDVEGCLTASKEAERRLGPYLPALGTDRSVDPSGFAVARAFLAELHRVSGGFGKDRSLASEGLGLLAQLAGDFYRGQASALAGPDYQKAIGNAGAPGGGDQAAWLDRAGQLAYWMLDQEKMAEVALKLVSAIQSDRNRGVGFARHGESLRWVMQRGRDTLRILGRDQEAKRVELVLATLETKALTPPELAFELGPDPEKFQTDLARARQELGALASGAPLHSRPSVLLHFMAAYAGILSGEPEAAEGLSDIRETLPLVDPYLATRSLGLLGRGALLVGDYYRASALLGQASSEMGKQKNTGLLHGLLVANTAQSRFYLGEYPQAAVDYQESARLLGGNPQLAVKGMLGAAHALVFAGNLDRAESLLRQAEGWMGSLPDNQRQALSRDLRLDRALWLVMSERRPEAVQLFAEVARDAVAASDFRSGAIARTNLAELFNDASEPKRALVETESALRWLNQANQPDAVWQAFCEKARALAALGRKKEALHNFERAMDLVERLRALIGAEGSRRSFLAAKTRLYRQAVSLLESMGKHAQAFRVSERARSRAFLDMLAERRLKLGQSGLQEKLGPARERMLRFLPPLCLDFDEPGSAVGGRAVPAGNIEGSLPKPDPSRGWVSLVTVNPAQVDDVQRVLREEEALLSYFHDGQRLLSFLITRRDLAVQAVEVGERELENQIESFLRMLRKPHRPERLLKKKSQRLYKTVFEPLEERLRARRVVVVPWGPLHYVPFLALWDGHGYLADRFKELASVPSASVLVMIRTAARRPQGGILAMGNPKTDLPDLPAAVLEVRILGRLFNQAEVLTGDRATKQVFVEAAPGSQMVHIASHGVFFPERPMDSYLALSGELPKGGRLLAKEILELDLSGTRLVVLSACDTGRSQVLKGDEIIGISRAFLHAGTTALLASLWPLSDESAPLIIERFYQEVHRGARPAAALNQAARETKAVPRFSHPFFWAPFEIIGG